MARFNSKSMSGQIGGIGGNFWSIWWNVKDKEVYFLQKGWARLAGVKESSKMETGFTET